LELIQRLTTITKKILLNGLKVYVPNAIVNLLLIVAVQVVSLLLRADFYLLSGLLMIVRPLVKTIKI